MKRIECLLYLEGHGHFGPSREFRFAFEDSAPQRYSGIKYSAKECDAFWSTQMRGRQYLFELNDPEQSRYMTGLKDAIYERYNQIRDSVLSSPNRKIMRKLGGGTVEFVYYIPPDVPEIKMSVTNQKIDTNFAVLSFHIQAYKNAPNGQEIEVSGPDDVKRHFSPGTVSETIEELLRTHGLRGADIINISGDVTGSRDPGSWDFWMFCRNPNSTIDALRRAQIEAEKHGH